MGLFIGHLGGKLGLDVLEVKACDQGIEIDINAIDQVTRADEVNLLEVNQRFAKDWVGKVARSELYHQRKRT